MLGTTCGASEGPTLGTYDDTNLVSLEVFADGTADVNFDGFLLGSRLVSVYVLKLGTNNVAELVFWGRKLLGTTLGAIYTLCIWWYRARIMRRIDCCFY